jgi:hypothetical protein
MDLKEVLIMITGATAAVYLQSATWKSVFRKWHIKMKDNVIMKNCFLLSL